MYVLATLYIALGFGALAALATMILRIGALIGAALPLLSEAPLAGFLGALGFAALCLGLDFTQAVGTLRALMQDAAAKA